jgi:hypothetical protein
MALQLLPEDVATDDAERIMRFVNAAGDAAVLADAVGFAEGREVGLQVGRGILAARAREGRLGSLERLFGIAEVTPPRFAEIVMAFSSTRPVPLSRGGGLRIETAAASAWLGVPVGLKVTRRDAAGAPLPGLPVTVAAGWGRLAAADGMGAGPGAVVTVATGRDGAARLLLGPDLDPPLAPGEADALQAAFAGLGPDATPEALAARLAELAEAYRAGTAAALSRALERLCARDDIGPAASALPPATHTVTLVAMTDGGGPVAVALLTFRDWRAGFLAALADAVRSGAVLETLLGALGTNSNPDARMVRGLLAAAAAAEGAETGLLAGGFGRDAAAAAVGRFLDARTTAETGLSGLVRAAGAAIEAEGFRVIDAVETVQDLRGTGGLGSTIGGKLAGRMDLLERTAATRAALDAVADQLSTKADATGLATLASRLEAAGVRVAALEAGVATLDRGLQDGLAAKADAAAMTALGRRLGGVETRLDAKAEVTDLVALGNRIDAGLAAKLDVGALTALTGRVAATEQGLGSLTAQIRGVTGSVDGLRQRIDTIDTRRLAEVEAELSKLGSTLGEIDQRLRAVDLQVDGLRQDVVKLERQTVKTDDLRDLRTGITAANDRTAALAGQVSTIGAGLDSLRTDVASVRVDNQRIAGRVDTVSSRVDTISGPGPLRPLR